MKYVVIFLSGVFAGLYGMYLAEIYDDSTELMKSYDQWKKRD